MTNPNARHIDPTTLPPSYLNALLAQVSRERATEADRAFRETHSKGFEILDDEFDDL